MEDPDPDGWSVAKAVGLVLLGTAMAAASADPLVDAVQNISNATRIPPFIVSVVLPLATNSIGEPVSSVMCVRNKRMRTASLTFSEVGEHHCAAVQRRDHEEHAVPGRVPVAHLRQEPGVGVLVRGAHRPPRLRRHGPPHQLPDDVPARDLPRGLHTVPPLSLSSTSSTTSSTGHRLKIDFLIGGHFNL